MKKKVLGKGLEALIPRREAPAEVSPASERLLEIEIDRIRPNPFQPRTQFPASDLDTLADSIRNNGLVQPIIVRPSGAGYQIVAGERRWRAAQRASLKKIPALVRTVPSERMLELALIENLQREQLNPIEEATAYQRLVEDFSLTQEQIAERVGKNRATIANILRLLQLSATVRDLLGASKISMGHARALLSLESAAEQKRAAHTILERNLSVRDTEALVRRMLREKTGRGGAHIKSADPNRSAAEDKLRLRYRTQVRINGANKGRIELAFFSEDDLQRLYEELLR